MDQKAEAFLRDAKNTLMVVSTINADGSPEAAVVGFSVLSRGRILLGTSQKSRKFANIERDPRVAIVVGWGDRTLQVEGEAEVATGDITPLRDLHTSKLPMAVKYADDPDQRWILVTPKWYKFTDFTSRQETITEASV